MEDGGMLKRLFGRFPSSRLRKAFPVLLCFCWVVLFRLCLEFWRPRTDQASETHVPRTPIELQAKLTKIQKSLVTLSSFSRIYQYLLSIFSGPGCKDLTMEKKGIDSASWLLRFAEFPQFFSVLSSDSSGFFILRQESFTTSTYRPWRRRPWRANNLLCVSAISYVCVSLYVYTSTVIVNTYDQIIRLHTIICIYTYIYIIKGSLNEKLPTGRDSKLREKNREKRREE